MQQTSLAECKGFVDKIYPSPYTSCILANCTLPMPSSDNVALTSKVIRFHFVNCMPVHFDHNYAAQTEFGKPLVDSTFTLALVTEQSVTYISRTSSPTSAGTR